MKGIGERPPGQITTMEEVKREEYLMSMRQAHLAIVDAIEVRLGMERTSDIRKHWKAYRNTYIDERP